MPRYIVKLQDYYFEYSSIVNAPVTFGMKLEEFKEYYQEEYGLDVMKELDQRLERVEQYGTSSRNELSAEVMLAGNEAGPNGRKLSVREIFKAYCLQEPIRKGWMVP